MSRYQKIWLLILRLVMGWVFFYAGITKILKEGWSAAGYLKNAQSFSGIFEWLAQPGVVDVVSFVNQWGLTLLGVSLLLGLLVRLSASLGALLMLLYYAALPFPKPNPNAFIVDEHIVYATVLVYLAVVGAGRVWGLDGWLQSRKERLSK